MSPLRVQDVRLDYDNSQIYISATLLDRSPYLGKIHNRTCEPAQVAQSDASPTGDQRIAGSIPAGSGNILS